MPRRRRFLPIHCRQCGRPLFLLPQCPYPVPQTPPDDAPDHGEQEQPPRRAARRPAARSRTKTSAAATVLSPTVASPGPHTAARSEPAVRLSSRRRRVLTPLRFTGLAAVVLLSATGYWIHHRSVQSRAERAFRHSCDVGYAALKDRDYLAARRAFREALQAADLLKRHDATSRHVRQMYRECEAATGLSPRPLFEMIAEADALRREAPDRWEQRFRRDYAQTWLVLDTSVRIPHGDSGAGRIALDYPLVIGGRAVELDGNLPVLKRLKLTPQGRRVILAVQLESCRLSGEQRWLVRFRGETAFLWTNYEILSELGLAEGPTLPDESSTGAAAGKTLHALLRTQSEIMGIAE